MDLEILTNEELRAKADELGVSANVTRRETLIRHITAAKGGAV